MMTGTIYSITNTLNGKRYIGSCTDTAVRWKNHRNTLRNGKHHNCHLQASYNIHGSEAFEYEVLMVCDANARHRLEEFAFNMFRHTGLYNVKQVSLGGSRRGMKNSEEHNHKIREAVLKQDWTEHKRAMAQWRANRSPEMEAERCRKISEKIKGTGPTRKRPTPKSEETKAKQRATLKATLAAKRLVRASAPARNDRTETSPVVSSVDTGPSANSAIET